MSILINGKSSKTIKRHAWKIECKSDFRSINHKCHALDLTTNIKRVASCKVKYAFLLFLLVIFNVELFDYYQNGHVEM